MYRLSILSKLFIGQPPPADPFPPKDGGALSSPPSFAERMLLCRTLSNLTPRRLTLVQSASLGGTEALLSGEAYWRVARDLVGELISTQLSEALNGGLSPLLGDISLEHYALEGQFDRAVCRLKLNNLGASRFIVHTSFYRESSLITLAVQEGVSTFEEIH